MKNRFEKLRKLNNSWRKPWCLVMFCCFWILIIVGMYLISQKTGERMDVFREPYGELIAKISQGITLMMFFCGALGVTIGAYISGRLGLGLRPLVIDLYDELEKLKQASEARALQRPSNRMDEDQEA